MRLKSKMKKGPSDGKKETEGALQDVDDFYVYLYDEEEMNAN